LVTIPQAGTCERNQVCTAGMSAKTWHKPLPTAIQMRTESRFQILHICALEADAHSE